MRLEEITSIFGAVRSGNEWNAKCPAHDDSTPSLYIRNGGGKILVVCHAGCDTETVLATKSLTLADLFCEPKADNGSFVEYPYHDENGRLLYQVIRTYPKSFKQRRLAPNGEWVWHMKCENRTPEECREAGHEPLPPVRELLYRTPDLVRHDASMPVFFVEGEKDADALSSIGLTATSNLGGAERWKNGCAADLSILKDLEVVVIPDNDPAGRTHAGHVKTEVGKYAANVRILELPNLPPKGDVSDWLALGGNAAQLLALAAEASKPRADRWPTLARVLESMPPPGDRLATAFPTLNTCLRGGLAPGRIHTIIGPPHRGKTALLTQLMLKTVKDQGAVGVGLYYDEGNWQASLMALEALGFDRATLEDRYPDIKADVEAASSPLRMWMPDPAANDSELEAVEEGLTSDGYSASRVVIVVDSIQRARCRAAATAKNAKERADIVMTTMRDILRRHPNWIILAAAKANRGSWANKNPAMNFDPMAAGLDSSSIEYDSDFMAFLDGTINKGLKLIVVKNRPGTGDTPTFSLQFDRARATFSELDQEFVEAEATENRNAKKAAEHQEAVMNIASRAERILKKTAPARVSFTFLRKALGGKPQNILEALEGLENQGVADWQEGPRDSQMWGWKERVS